VGAPGPHHAPIYVSVNVSARQFRDPGFVDGVRRVLAESGLAPSALMLELTESVLLRRDDRIHSDLMELKDIGVKLAIDDFGTGTPPQLPAGAADRRAEDRQVFRRRDRHLRPAAGPRGRHRPDRQELQLSVIAEGIETEAQRDLLVSMGCRFGQGYLLAMPVPADQAEALVRSGAAWCRASPDKPLTAGTRPCR